MAELCTEERFLTDVRDHKMEIIRDDGEYRHIRFRIPGSNIYMFDLVTWPEHLAFTGDMGTQVFRRVRDMFTFFRDDRKKDSGMSINPGYWGEKLQSVGTWGGYREFDLELLKECIREDFDTHYEESSDERKAGAWEEIQSEIIDFLEDNNDMSAAIRLVMDFESDEYGYPFDDFWEHNFERFTFHYIWQCYAMVWGIAKYDSHKAKTNEE